ncbi:MAG: STAS domain-containing protein [Lachnospiraceae bacterium]|nr:STAS domain-containing protein [Lachnospiraceae bacterium]
MEIIKEKNADGMKIKVIGELDTKTSPELQKVVDSEVVADMDLCFEFSELEYLSSAGLAVLLTAQKKIGTKKIKLMGLNEVVREIFEETGFDALYDIV